MNTFNTVYDSVAAARDAVKPAYVVFKSTWRESYDARQVQRGVAAAVRMAARAATAA